MRMNVAQRLVEPAFTSFPALRHHCEATSKLTEDFAQRPVPTVQPAALSELTPRELEVLELIAHGNSNADIAGELVISDATVKTHVARIFSKLDLQDRAQAVVLAYETGLVSAWNPASRANRQPDCHGGDHR